MSPSARHGHRSDSGSLEEASDATAPTQAEGPPVDTRLRQRTEGYAPAQAETSTRRQTEATMTKKYCLEHGIVEPNHNCKRRPARTRRYFRAARQVRDNATTCALCGKGERENDPWVADHIIPRAEGGTDHISNLQPAHRSCNGRRGQAMQQ
jgi:5-methylcytosine-specific restriction endonuclease McrA